MPGRIDEREGASPRVPEGALYHDPNAYLKSEHFKDVVALM